MAAVAAPIEQQGKRFKMRITPATYDQDLGGRLPVDEVVIVDFDTAVRWLEFGIAEQAGDGEQSMREKRRAELAARLTPIADDEYDSAAEVIRPGRKPARRCRAAVPPKLVGAGVINSLDDVPDQYVG